MENASKALIVAGSVLLAILIIGLGIYIVNVSSVDMESTKNQVSNDAFNNKYLIYEGVQRGKKIKEVLTMIAIDNEELVSRRNFKVVAIGVRSNSKDLLDKSTSASMTSALDGSRDYGVIQPPNIRSISGWLKLNKKYKISFGFSKYGRINEIHIDEIY